MLPLNAAWTFEIAAAPPRVIILLKSIRATTLSHQHTIAMEEKQYDLIVIGSGPAGEKGAAQAAYFGKKVALIEKEPVLGGAAANTGTLPSKTLRESALYLSGFKQTDCTASVSISRTR